MSESWLGVDIVGGGDGTPAFALALARGRWVSQEWRGHEDHVNQDGRRHDAPSTPKR